MNYELVATLKKKVSAKKGSTYKVIEVVATNGEEFHKVGALFLDETQNTILELLKIKEVEE